MKTLVALPVAGALALASAACGEPGSSGTPPPDDISGEGCEPIPGDTLVALEDDQQLQAAENVVAAFHADSADEAAITAVDEVTATLTTERLTELNKAVDIDRESPAEAAQAFADNVDLNDLEDGAGSIIIGHADYSESEILGNLYQIALEEAGFETELQDVGNRETYLQALQDGDVQLIPEYAASLTEALNPDTTADADLDPIASSDVDATMETLTDIAAEQDIALGSPAEALAANAYVVTEAFAAEHDIATLTEFGEKCSGIDSVLAGPPECPERVYCRAGLEETYNIEFGVFNSLDIGTSSKQSVASGESTVGTVITTDSALAEGVSVDS